MANLAGFKASDHKDMNTFDVLPVNKYAGVVVASEMKQTADGTGSYLEIKFEVMEGEYKGRNLWTRLNLVNKSSEAQGIAYRELATLARAVGITGEINDSIELHNRPLTLDVGVEPQTEGKGKERKTIPNQFRNKIKTYLVYGATSTTAAGATVTHGGPPPAIAAAVAAAAPPWAVKK